MTPASDRSCSGYRTGPASSSSSGSTSTSASGYTRLRKVLHFIGAATDCALLLIRYLPDVIADIGIHLLIFPTPLTYDLPIGLPYVATIPDMLHHYMPDAPDYGPTIVRKRDIIYGYYARHSRLNTADSDQSRADIERYLKVAAGKTRVIPYIAPNYIYEFREMPREQARALLAGYELPERFVFYPGAVLASEESRSG